MSDVLYRACLLAASVLLLVSCAKVDASDYPDYESKRGQASARCAELGLLIGSPEFYSCVGTQYTRIQAHQ